VAGAVRPGSIVLLHDAHPWTAQAVRLILRNLKRQHLHPVTLQTLLELDPPRGHCA
jgi:peptidoglycan/xylan/chitin deacetylase (PgdA/CDA1 family)